MFFLTAVTRKLAIASFLCEYSGAFSGTFSKIRLDIYIYILTNSYAFKLRISCMYIIIIIIIDGPRSGSQSEHRIHFSFFPLEDSAI